MRKGFGVIPDSLAAIWCPTDTNTRKSEMPVYGLPRASGDFATSTRAREARTTSVYPTTHNHLAGIIYSHFWRHNPLLDPVGVH
jgi:hypothetical protein